MKTLLQNTRMVLALSLLLAMPQFVSAATKKFAMSISPGSTNVLNATATNVTAIITFSTAAGNGFTGVVTNGVTISPAGQGVTASFSGASVITTSNSPTVLSNGAAGVTLTLYIAATAGATPNTAYKVTVTGTNAAATGNVPSGQATVTYTFTVGSVPIDTWTAAGGTLNWSTPGNWSLNAAPTSINDVVFNDTGANGSAGVVDNVANGNFAIDSLTYGQTNGFHTTQIASGSAVTLGADLIGLVVGTGTDNGGQVTTAAITGAGGALLVTNPAVSVVVSQAHSVSSGVSGAQATLDLSGLDTFSAAISRLIVGVDLTVKGASGILNLARTNVLTLTPGSPGPQIDIGDNSQPQGVADIPSVLALGQTNAILADSIVVGRGKTDNTGSSISFNSLFTGPVAYIRGTNGGNGRVGTWYIGDGYGSKYTSFVAAVGTCDFSLGTVNALVDTLYVGKGADVNIGTGANIQGLGTLTLGLGTFNVNTLEVGYSVSAAGNGTVNALGGALQVNTVLELAHGSGSSGTLNVSNAAVTATSGVIAGGGTATITMTGGTLAVTNGTATVGTAASPVNTLSVSNSVLTLAVQSLVPVVVVDNLAGNGTANLINVSAVPLLTGFPAQFPVIQYGLNSGTGSGQGTFVLGSLPAGSPAYAAYVSNNVANSSIDIVFTAGPSVPALTWDGTLGGNWDITTKDWRPKSGPDTSFAQGDYAIFNDTLTGTPNVNLAAALSPASVTVSNSAASYVFSGSGSISCTNLFTKSGPGTLTLVETGADNLSGGLSVSNGTVILDNLNGIFTGNTTISAGTVQLGNNDARGTLPSGSVTDNGTLVFARSDSLAVSNAISGAGMVMQSAAATLTMSGNSTFGGMFTVQQGILKVGSTNGLGQATNVTVNSGATLDVNGFAPYGNGNSNLVVTVSGIGVAGNGAIVNSNTNQTAKTFHVVTLAADTTFGGTADWEIRNTSGKSTGADGQLNGAFNLTKVGSNTVSLTSLTLDPNLGNITVQAGSITLSASATAPLNSLGSAGASVIIYTNATFTLDAIGTVPDKNYLLTNGGTLKSTPGTNILSVNSTVTLAGAGNTLSVNSNYLFIINGLVTGSGGLSKNGNGTVVLPVTEAYTGGTVVNGGTLALYGGGADGSIASSTNIGISSGATLDVSGRSDSTLTLVSGETLNGGMGTNGPGMITGNLIAGAGSTVAPAPGSTNCGTIAVSGSATLQGATFMRLNTLATYVNDQLAANTLAYGGTLVVTNISGTFTNGQTFQLFVASNGVYNAGTFTSVTLPTVTGVTWTNNLAVNGTITAATANSQLPRPQITGILLTGTNLVISGTNSVASSHYTLLTSTNVALPLIQWATLGSGTFGGATFSLTNGVNPNALQNYYTLLVQ